jgi:hypothetical protein
MQRHGIIIPEYIYVPGATDNGSGGQRIDHASRSRRVRGRALRNGSLCCAKSIPGLSPVRTTSPHDKASGRSLAGLQEETPWPNPKELGVYNSCLLHSNLICLILSISNKARADEGVTSSSPLSRTKGLAFMEPKRNSTQSPASCPTASFLRSLAAALDTLARQSYARAEVSARYGNAAASVRETSKAVDYECHAETLRLRAQRLADRAVDEMEMMAEGFSAGDIAQYVRRAYGQAVRS